MLYLIIILILIEVNVLVLGYESMFAVLGALLGFVIVLIIGFYVYTSLVLMTIAKKTRTKDPWMAWIPILNLYLMAKIAKAPWWTLIVMIISVFVPVIGFAISTGIMLWWWWNICKARKKPEWYSLLLLIPIVNLIIMGIIAWSD